MRPLSTACSRSVAAAIAAGQLLVLSGCNLAGGRHGAQRTPVPTRPASPAGPTASGNFTGLRVCSLLTPGEVRQALALPVDPAPQQTPDGHTCRYVPPDGASVLTVTVSAQPRAVMGSPDQVAAMGARDPRTAQDVPGVGDAAVFWSQPGGGEGLVVARADGPLVTTVDLEATAPADGRDGLVVLARTALAATPTAWG